MGIIRMDSLIAQFEPKTGSWRKIQIPYSWPELDVASGLLRIHALQNGTCIHEYSGDWAWAECLLPDAHVEHPVLLEGGTAVVQFLEPATGQPFTIWADDVQVEFEHGYHPTLFDPNTGYGVMFFAQPLEIFENDAIGRAFYHHVVPSILEP